MTMTLETPAHACWKSTLRRHTAEATGVLARIPQGAIGLLARFAMASVFWASARTKVEEGTLFTLSDNAVYLFREEYKLPLIPPELAAHLALVGEHVLPILLVVGIASRFAALGLLAMTLVIQIFVYPDAYGVHATWATCLLVIVKYGAGPISLDHLVRRLDDRRGPTAVRGNS
jgi:putative oxidoreductase